MQLGAAAGRGTQSTSEYEVECVPWLLACNATRAQERCTRAAQMMGLAVAFDSE